MHALESNPRITWGIDIQSEKHQHSSKALEEVVIALVLHSIVNEDLFFLKNSCFVKGAIRKEENLEAGNEDLG